jgi:NADH:ubiquinone oxidoreductase subunit E
VELCLGSSCFARGNSQALSMLEAYIKEHHLEDKVRLVGICATMPVPSDRMSPLMASSTTE